MASPARPSGRDDDRSNNPSEPVDPKRINEAADEPVYQGRDFPAGGGERGGTPGGRDTGATVARGDRGSTGRGATDAGKTDSEGMAGSAGG